MSAFKVGEIAILQNMTGGAAIYNGAECEVTEPLTRRTMPVLNIDIDVYTIRHPDGADAYVLESWLRKKQPPQSDSDINTVVEWKDCAWQPSRVPA